MVSPRFCSRPICEPWCWYIKTYKAGWFLGKMLVNILYMEHMGVFPSVLGLLDLTWSVFWHHSLRWKSEITHLCLWGWAKTIIPYRSSKCCKRAIVCFRSIWSCVGLNPHCWQGWIRHLVFCGYLLFSSSSGGQFMKIPHKLGLSWLVWK